MPYVKQEDRIKLDPLVEALDTIATVGELNYVVTRLSLRFLKRLGLSYSNISNVVGTLHLIPVEMTRRLVDAYENNKIEENGDVLEYKGSFWR